MRDLATTPLPPSLTATPASTSAGRPASDDNGASFAAQLQRRQDRTADARAAPSPGGAVAGARAGRSAVSDNLGPECRAAAAVAEETTSQTERPTGRPTEGPTARRTERLTERLTDLSSGQPSERLAPGPADAAALPADPPVIPGEAHDDDALADFLAQLWPGAVAPAAAPLQADAQPPAPPAATCAPAPTADAALAPAQPGLAATPPPARTLPTTAGNSAEAGPPRRSTAPGAEAKSRAGAGAAAGAAKASHTGLTTSEPAPLGPPAEGADDDGARLVGPEGPTRGQAEPAPTGAPATAPVAPSDPTLNPAVAAAGVAGQRGAPTAGDTNNTSHDLGDASHPPLAASVASANADTNALHRPESNDSTPASARPGRHGAGSADSGGSVHGATPAAAAQPFATEAPRSNRGEDASSTGTPALPDPTTPASAPSAAPAWTGAPPAVARAELRGGLPELQVDVATPVHAPQFADALGVHVSVLARDGIERAELHLHPASMGPLSVQIALDGQQAQVHFGTDSAQTRQIVEAGLPALAAALRDAGLTLTGGGVSQHAGGQRQGTAPRGSTSFGMRTDAAIDDELRPLRATRPVSGRLDLYA